MQKDVMRIKSWAGMVGHLRMIATDAATGEIIDTYVDEHNVILSQSPEQIFMALNTKASDAYTVKTIVLGSDVGTGTIITPEAATAALTEDDMDVVFEIPSSEFSFSIDGNSCNYAATINGADVMLLYPEQPNVVYTSACIVGENGKAIAYKRFGARTISAAINIQTFWTLTLNI